MKSKRTGRPALDASERRRNVIRPSFTDDEYSCIVKLADRTGETPAAFVRRTMVPVIKNTEERGISNGS